jgi:hypothetical protein
MDPGAGEERGSGPAAEQPGRRWGAGGVFQLCSGQLSRIRLLLVGKQKGGEAVCNQYFSSGGGGKRKSSGLVDRGQIADIAIYRRARIINVKLPISEHSLDIVCKQLVPHFSALWAASLLGCRELPTPA